MSHLKVAVFIAAIIFLAPNAEAGLIANRGSEGSSVDAQVKIDRQAAPELTSLKTYNWIPAKETRLSDPKYYDLDLDTWVREAADKELQSKGYVRQDNGDPDIWVTYGAAVETETTSQTVRVPTHTGGSSGFPRAGGSFPSMDQEVTFTDSMDKGELAIGMFSGSDRKTLWQASAQGEVHEKVDRQTRQERVAKVVSKIMASVPPARTN